MMSEVTEKPIVVTPANRLAGKVALITGGTRGIGFAVAKAYVAEGAKVIIASRTSEELKIALNQLKDMGADATAIKANLTSRDACESLYTAAIRSYGKIDVLVNNASILGPMSTIVNYPPAEWAAVMDANLNAPFWLTRAVLGTMIPANTGSIINVTSGVAAKGRAKWGAYAVSKAALLNLTEVLADEVKGYNVRVNAINPGPTRTMMRAEAFPKEDPATLPAPEDIVNPFIYLASDVSKGVTGTALDAKDWFGRSF